MPWIAYSEPSGGIIDDSVRAKRIFIVASYKPATLTFYSDGELKHTSDPGVQEASYRMPRSSLALK